MYHCLVAGSRKAPSGTGPLRSSPQSVDQNPESKSRIRNPNPESRTSACNPESRIQNPGCGSPPQELAAVRGPESRIQIQNPESKSGIQKSRIQNPESGMRIGPSGPRCSPCQNPESKSRIHDPDRTPSELSQAGAFSCEWSLRIQNQNPESSLEEYNSQYSSARCHYSAKIRRGNVGGCHLVSTQCHTHINTSTC